MEKVIEESKQEELDSKNSYNNLGKILILSIFMGVLFGFVFKGEIRFDVSILITFICFYVGFFLIFKNKITSETKFAWFLLVPIFLQVFACMIFYNLWIQVINLFCVSLLVLIQTILISKENIHLWDKIEFLFELIYNTLFRIIGKCLDIFPYINYSTKSNRENSKGSIINKIIIGLVISVPLIIIMIVLLSSADKVFSDILKNLTVDINFGTIFYRIIISVIVIVLMFGYLKALYKEENRADFKEFGINIKFDGIILATILFMINIIFIMFTVIQFKYLFSGNYIPGEFSFAEYARKGFFELVFVSAINLFVLIFTYNIKNIKNLTFNILFKGLQCLLVFNTLVMLYSAFIRMNKYEAEYGYTILRILTELIMLFLLVLFILSVIKILYNKMNIIKSYIIVSIIGFSLLSYVNIDGYVARKNVDFYNATGKIDVRYFEDLSDSAIIEIVKLKDLPENSKELANFNNNERVYSSYYENYSPKEVLVNYLNSKKEEYEKVDVSNLYFNYTKYKVKNILSNINDYEIMK